MPTLADITDLVLEDLKKTTATKSPTTLHQAPPPCPDHPPTHLKCTPSSRE